MNTLQYIHHAHAMAVGAADEDAAAELTVLINALEEGDEPTTGTTDTTGSTARVDTILSEAGIVPSGINQPEQDVIVEIARLRGELNTATAERDDARGERDQARSMVAEHAFRIGKQREAIDALHADLNAARDELGARVDPDHYTVDGLRHLAAQRGIDTGDASTKAELADAINNNPAAEGDTAENEES